MLGCPASKLSRTDRRLRPCRTFSAKNNSMAIITAVVRSRPQCCCHQVSAHAGQLKLAPQRIIQSCMWPPLTQHHQACTAPPCQHHSRSSTACSSPSTDSPPSLRGTAIMPVRGAANLQAVHRICAVHLSYHRPQPSALRAGPAAPTASNKEDGRIALQHHGAYAACLGSCTLKDGTAGVSSRC